MVERNPIDAFPVVELRNGQYWATPDFINFVQGDQEKLGNLDGQIEIGAGQVVSGTLADARISESSVTQHALPQPSVNAQTGTAYTLVAGDVFNVVTMDNAASNTVTIPAGLTGHVDVWRIGIGATTIEGDTDVTVNGSSGGSDVIGAQFSRVRAQRIAVDTWVVG